jgi:hypothetical protein
VVGWFSGELSNILAMKDKKNGNVYHKRANIIGSQKARVLSQERTKSMFKL